jgi:hypothetical protein
VNQKPEFTASRSGRSEFMKNANPCTHLAGEFFVSAELSRMGYNVALTIGVVCKQMGPKLSARDYVFGITVKFYFPPTEG